MSDNKYLVLARKYRPLNFDDLVGQDALVKTVLNAIKNNRVPHAYLLTGIRGIGKTTSARIIARTLNCIGQDGKSHIPFFPCGKCSHCKAIIDDRDIDVIEIDAASNTGVDNIRELIEGSKYAPVSARFKIYIIDEVHMLSKAAFNALLKTLEEPPEHVKFILATTEVRKIPVTILSRCQRFDLKRLSIELMAKHLGNLAKKEGVSITLEALNVLSLLSEGSARDGVSLLDQAISFSDKEITEETVKKMTGIADKSETCNLFYEIMAGNVKNALENINAQYENGTEPEIIMNDLLELTHIVSKIKAGSTIETALMTSDFSAKAKEFAKTLNMASLTLVWQMMVKSGREISSSPFPFKSLEMLLIRICYATGIPDFKELLKKNSDIEANITARQHTMPTPDAISSSLPSFSKGEAEKKSGFDLIKTPYDIYQLAERNKEAILAYNIKTYLRPIGIEQGKIKIAGNNEMSSEFTRILLKKLTEWTGERWEIEALEDKSSKADTLRERHEYGFDFMRDRCHENEIIKEILNSFDCIGVSKISILRKEKEEEYSADQNDEELYQMSQAGMMMDDY